MKIKLFLILLIISCYGFLNLNVVYSNECERSKIQKAIQEKGAKWIPGKTSVSYLSIEDKKNMCGVIFPENYPTRKRAESISLLVEDEYFNWKDEGVVTPVKNQGMCGSCWAFAAVGSFESNLLLRGISAGENLSEQLVVSCDTYNLGCDGGWMDLVYNFLWYMGTTEESCFTYQALDLYCDHPSKCNDWEQKLIRTDGWDWVNNNVNSIKNALVEHGPIPTTFNVYTDFYDYTEGVYEYVSGIKLGGHAVLIVGWDDTPEVYGGIGKPCWICKNSWGTNWGENGYFRIARGDSCNIGELSAYFKFESSCEDTDNDGICNNIDNCPEIANLVQKDTDNDGIGNACDNCIDIANPGQIDTDNDGIGDTCEIDPNNPDPINPDTDGDDDDIYIDIDVTNNYYSRKKGCFLGLF